MMTHRQIYEALVAKKKRAYTILGASEDKANRLANIYAVKNTKDVFNQQLTVKE